MDNAISLFLIRMILYVPIIVTSSTLMAQERLDMEGTSIIGNKELPNVLYIVPWKSAKTIALETPPFDSVLGDLLKPIERSTFKQQVKYYNELYPETANNP